MSPPRGADGGETIIGTTQPTRTKFGSIVTKGCEGVYRRVELRRNRISAAGPASAVNAYEPTVIIEHRATRESVIDGHLGVFEQTRV